MKEEFSQARRPVNVSLTNDLGVWLKPITLAAQKAEIGRIIV
jgi:hypothetical protein